MEGVYKMAVCTLGGNELRAFNIALHSICGAVAVFISYKEKGNKTSIHIFVILNAYKAQVDLL